MSYLIRLNNTPLSYHLYTHNITNLVARILVSEKIIVLLLHNSILHQVENLQN